MHEDNGVISQTDEIIQRCSFDLCKGGISDEEIIQGYAREINRIAELLYTIKNDR